MTPQEKREKKALEESQLAKPGSGKESRSLEGQETAIRGFGQLQREWEFTFSAIPDPVMILDTRHRIVRLNRAMAKALGREAPEVMGKACYEILHGSKAPISCCPHSQLLHDGREHFTEVKDEKLGGTFRVSVSPLYDERHRLIGSVHVARDITEIKKAEEELRLAGKELERRVEERTAELRAANEKLRLEIRERETAEQALRLSEERFRAICEGAEDLIFVKDLDRKYTHVKPCYGTFSFASRFENHRLQSRRSLRSEGRKPHSRGGSQGAERRFR